MTGKSVGEAFDQIVGTFSGYEWRVGYAGVVNLLPRQPRDGATPLLTPVPEFVLREATISEALAAIHRIFDRTYRSGGTLSFGPTPDPDEHAAQRLEQNKPITIALRDGTVLDVLNAIVAAHGTATWQVRYRYTQAVYQNSEITFRGFTGWSIGSSGRPSNSRRD